MRRVAFLPLLFLAWFVLPGCGQDDGDSGGDADGTDTFVPPEAGDGDSDADDDGEASAGACDFAPPPAATVSVLGPPTTFETVTGAAMNSPALDSLSPLPHPRFGALRAGPCGTVGLAYRRTVGGEQALAYVELDDGSTHAPGAPQTVAAGDPGLVLSLFFEDDCSPVILQAVGDEWREHRSDGTTWTATDAGLDLAALTGSTGMMPTAAGVGRDGRWHLFAHTGVGGAGRLIHGSRAAAAGGSWEWEALPLPEATEVYAYAVDAAGAIHALYRQQEVPCDPCDVNLYHGRLPPGGTWTRATAQAGVWGPPLDEFVDEAALDIDADDRPIFAGHFVRRVETGSLQSAELRVWLGEGDGFCAEVVAQANDGYAGEDGTRFTGAEPFLALDDAGRAHVLFLDQSVWHDGSGWANEFRGQIRHAQRGTAGWTVTRLADQPGRTESPRPLIGYGQMQFAVSPDGSRFVAVAVERTWDTDSIYNSSDVPATLRAQAIYGSLAP